MADKKAKVTANASASEETQAPASGGSVANVQNENGVKAKVNPALKVTSVSLYNEDGELENYATGVTHTVSKGFLDLTNPNKVNYFVEVNE